MNTETKHTVYIKQVWRKHTCISYIEFKGETHSKNLVAKNITVKETQLLTNIVRKVLSLDFVVFKRRFSTSFVVELIHKNCIRICLSNK